MRISTRLLLSAAVLSASAICSAQTPPPSGGGSMMMMHKPDPKRMADFEACQNDAKIVLPTEDQKKKIHECMESKKPAAPPASGDKSSFFKAQMEARKACEEGAGVKSPTKDQMIAVHTCMDGKGYKDYHPMGGDAPKK